MVRRRASELATLNEIARLVAGDKARDWLAELLGDFKDGPLFLNRIVALIEPTPTQFRSRIDRLRKAAVLIIRETLSPTMREFLGAPSSGVISDENLRDALIDVVGKRTERAAKHRSVADAAGHAKRGRGRVRTPGRLPPEVICAVLIVETWRYFRGKAPTPGSLKAASAAEKYWRLAGGNAPKVVQQPLARWKLRFVAALKGVSDPKRGESLEQLRTAIHLSLHEREGGVTSIGEIGSPD